VNVLADGSRGRGRGRFQEVKARPGSSLCVFVSKNFLKR
tara:strand:- start:490 stop:606 length:117 start_codon:yes stop_codon:yes gene_type:complete